MTFPSTASRLNNILSRIIHLPPVDGETIPLMCFVQIDIGSARLISLAIHDMHLIANNPLDIDATVSLVNYIS